MSDTLDAAVGAVVGLITCCETSCSSSSHGSGCACSTMLMASMLIVSHSQAGASIKAVDLLTTSGKSAAISFEFVHRHSWENGCSMVLGCVVMNLVDWYSGVDNFWLDSFLVNDRLDVFVDMMMHVFTLLHWYLGLCVLRVYNGPLIPELSSFGLESFFDIALIAVAHFSVLHSSNVVGVLLGQNFPVSDWHDGRVVVVLVDLLVHGSDDILMASWLHSLVGHCRVDILVYGCVMVPGLVEETADGCLC